MRVSCRARNDKNWPKKRETARSRRQAAFVSGQHDPRFEQAAGLYP